MKKFLQFSGVISALLALVAFILMLATPAIVGSTALGDWSVAGTTAIFGSKTETIIGTAVTKPSVLALIGWILGLVGLLVVVCGFVLPLLKVKGIEKFAGLMNLCAVACLVLAGVFMFLVIPTFYGANETDIPDSAAIGAGWVIGAILYIAAGAIAIAPAAVDFFGKKKKR